jgi:phosphonate degradation associated HDIG domain protein
MGDIARIVELFERRGDSEYGGENVTQLEHALQCGFFAERAGATPNLITASLLHDVGHLLHDLPDDAPESGVDDVHEALGDRYLRRYFSEAVCEPVRLHVAAKRYLCAVDTEYFNTLSAPSVTSLKLQGGPMTPAEVTEFEANPYFQDAVALRRWDDAAKIVNFQTPPLDHFVTYLKAADRPVRQTEKE